MTGGLNDEMVIMLDKLLRPKPVRSQNWLVYICFKCNGRRINKYHSQVWNYFNTSGCPLLRNKVQNFI